MKGAILFQPMALICLALAISTPGAKAETQLALQPGTDDLRTFHRLETTLATLPGYSVFDYLTFRFGDDGLVLLGQVVHPELRKQAEDAVRQIVSLPRIDNRIRVLPGSAEDDRLRSALYRSIYGDPVLGSYATRALAPIHILVENGRVTLEGAVQTPVDRIFAESAATEAGATAVEDHLLIAEDNGLQATIGAQRSNMPLRRFHLFNQLPKGESRLC
jgi:hyperosmotically inducible periplasmic protein